MSDQGAEALRAFRRTFTRANEAEREVLERLAVWAEVLERDGLAELEFRDGGIRPRLRLSPPGSNALITIYNDDQGTTRAYIEPYRSRFERLAKSSIASVERAGGTTMNKEFGSITDELLEALTGAFRDASGLLSGAQSEPVLTEVPIESQYTEDVTVSHASASYTAKRREQKLVLKYEEYLLTKGIRLSRFRIRPPGEVEDLVCDIYDRTRGNLIEAKASGTRGELRMAIGQVLDYGRFIEPVPARAVLLPSRPRPDLEDLLMAAETYAVWPSGEGFVDNANGRFT